MRDRYNEIQEIDDDSTDQNRSEQLLPSPTYNHLKDILWTHHQCKESSSNNIIPPMVNEHPGKRSGSISGKYVMDKSFPTVSHVFPMSVDITTQCTSDMGIVIKQDSRDKNIVNIKFGGAIRGNVEGDVSLQKSSLMSLLNDMISEQITQEMTRSILSNEKSNIVTELHNLERSRSRSSFKEENIDFFPSLPKTKSIVKQQKQREKGRVSQRQTVLPEVVNNRQSVGDEDRSFTDVGSVKAKHEQINARHVERANTAFSLPSFSNLPITKPAILPKSIVRRIMHTMVDQLDDPRKDNDSIFGLENKIDLNWHAATKGGKSMIREVIELVVQVTIGSSRKMYEEIECILDDLKREMVDVCSYLLSPTENSEAKEIWSLKLLVDIVLEEINLLKELSKEWTSSGWKGDLSTLYVSRFDSMTHANDSERFKMEEKDFDTMQNMIAQEFEDKGRSAMNQQQCHPVSSIITSSRMKKSMNTIMQVAVEENLTGFDLPRAVPNNALSTESIVAGNLGSSIIEELVQVEKKWSKPIVAGRWSIQDLIEFIINLSSNDHQLPKETFDDVLSELSQLEKELLLSVTSDLRLSRSAYDDLVIRCYELLAEIILEEISLARYVFQSLDVDTVGISSFHLGNLYRTYLSQMTKSSQNAKLTENYAHQTSEVRNYMPNEQNQIQSLRSHFSEQESSKKEPQSSLANKEMKGVVYQLSQEEHGLLMILIERLDIQIREIDSMKDNIRDLTAKFESRFSQCRCNFSLEKVNAYCLENVVEHTSLTGSDLGHGRTEKNNNKTPHSEGLFPGDLLHLIVEGSHDLLRWIYGGQNPDEKLDGQKTEFDEVFQWIVDTYLETIHGMLQTDDGTIFVYAINKLPPLEMYEIEKDLIKVILEENNVLIDNWMKEISYKILLNCLSPAKIAI